ncbi:hypothetical protein Tco_0590942, partial [Tanacetum coccineum]
EFDRDVYYKRRIIAVTKLQIIEWHGYKHLDWITVLRDDDKLYTFKEGDLKRLRRQDIEDMLILLAQGKLTNLNVEDLLSFDLISNAGMPIQHIPILEASSIRTKTRRTRIRMEYLPQTIWRQSDRERAKAMIQAINKQLKSRRIMRSLERFVGGRPYGDKMDSMHSTLSMYYDYGARVKGELLVMMKNFQKHLSDTQVFTMKMEILLEPTSNKLMVEHVEFDESDTHVLERLNTSAGNPVKEILLKLNLPDHRILKDGGEGAMEKDEDILETLVENIDEKRSFIQELELLPGSLLAYKTKEELKGLQKDDLIKAMEMRKVALQLHF